MNSYLSIMVLILLSVFTIPLMATPSQDNTGENYQRISIIISQEEVINQAVSAPIYEIMAIKPDKIVLIFPKDIDIILMKSVQFGKTYIDNLTKSFREVSRIKSGGH